MKPPDDFERTRRQPRLRVFDLLATSDELSFVILDFSASGLRIESRDPVQVGQNYGFTLQHRNEPIEVQGQVRWCKVHRTLDLGGGEFETIYRAGFAFQGGPPDISLPTDLPLPEPLSRL